MLCCRGLSKMFLLSADSYSLRSCITGESNAVLWQRHSLAASLPPGSGRVEGTCPPGGDGPEDPSTQEWLRQPHLWFSPWVLFNRGGIVVSLLWQTALCFLWFRTLMKINLEWTVIEGQLHLMARSIRAEQCVDWGMESIWNSVWEIRQMHRMSLPPCLIASFKWLFPLLLH